MLICLAVVSLPPLFPVTRLVTLPRWFQELLLELAPVAAKVMAAHSFDAAVVEEGLGALRNLALRDANKAGRACA